MKKLNLTPGFDTYPDHPYAGEVSLIDYPSGCEPHIRLNMFNGWNDELMVITSKIKKSDDIVRLAMVINHFKDLVSDLNKIVVFIPYFPHARQDRIAVDSDVFSFKHIASILSSHDVIVSALDVHNIDVARQYNVANSSPYKYIIASIDHFLEGRSKFALVFPDKGVRTRYEQTGLTNRILQKYGARNVEIINCDKVRDPSTGHITSIEVSSFETDNGDRIPSIIVDDICDGGGTFIPIAKKLLDTQYIEKVGLYTTHGLYTKGADTLLSNGFSNLYTTNSFIDRSNDPRVIINPIKFDNYNA